MNGAGVTPVPRDSTSRTATGTLVNDVHSQLNATRVHRIVSPRTLDDVQAAIVGAAAEGRAVSVAGGRHAMGGQQFGTDTVLIDMAAHKRVLAFDDEQGVVEIEAGMQWPDLIAHLADIQRGHAQQWGIVQKQTGADRLSIGGALSANVHGRGLTLQPIIADVESFTLVDGSGTPRRCSRHEHADLFRLAIGGYGLLGVITSVRLRLAPRRKVERVVEVIDAGDAIERFEKRIAAGFLYGDFQFSIDDRGDDFLRRGVFSCYRPVDARTPIAGVQQALTLQDWQRLLYLAHTDRRRAVDAYTAYYLSTSGQIYWSDTHQSSEYIDGYHQWLDQQMGATHPASEIITELYVPRPALAQFMDDARQALRQRQAEVIYGTVRLIERDEESFLAWAKAAYACIIFNLHTVHTPDGVAQSAQTFRDLIDLAIQHGGSFYLTYHRFATRQQVEACYPQFAEFLRQKRAHDPDERFQSDWYRHYGAVFSDVLHHGSAFPHVG